MDTSTEVFYQHHLVDVEPVRVKIIQSYKHRVEICRDFNSNSGFFVDKTELIYITKKNMTLKKGNPILLESNKPTFKLVIWFDVNDHPVSETILIDEFLYNSDTKFRSSVDLLLINLRFAIELDAKGRRGYDEIWRMLHYHYGETTIGCYLKSISDEDDKLHEDATEYPVLRFEIPKESDSGFYGYFTRCELTYFDETGREHTASFE